jgi:hypothetical protein
LLFPIPTTEKREEYIRFAKTLRHYLPENTRASSTWKTDYSLDYVHMPEMYGVMKNFTNEQLLSVIVELESLGRGESLPDYMPLVQFLGQLEGWGLHYHHDLQGGCF